MDESDRPLILARGVHRRGTEQAPEVSYTRPMPLYVYEIVEEDGSAGERFEVFQKMSDESLVVHPESGKPVKRVVTSANIAGTWSDSVTKQKLSNKNLDRLGFTKYERAGDGHYEKKAGEGPNAISAD